MEYIKTGIDGVWILEPRVFNDARGYFFEAWKQADFSIGKIAGKIKNCKFSLIN